MRARRRPRERGVVLILVLWVFMTLGVLAFDFSRYMRDDAEAALNLAEGTRSYYLAVAGMNRALYENWKERAESPGGVPEPDPEDAQAAGDQDGDGEPDANPFPADGEWHEDTLGEGKYAVRVVGEDGKIPLNVGSPDEPEYRDLLKLVVTNLIGGSAVQGLDVHEAKDVDTIIDSILDWRDCCRGCETARLNGAEDDYYLGLRRPYRAKNGYYESADELSFVRGVTPDLLLGTAERPGLLDVFSPYPKGHDFHDLNSNSITPAVLMALFPSEVPTWADADALITLRKEDPTAYLTWLQQNFAAVLPGITATPHVPEYVRVEARADLRFKRNQAAVAVLAQLPGANVDDLVVLEWIDRAPLRGPGPAGSEAQQAEATS